MCCNTSGISTLDDILATICVGITLSYTYNQVVYSRLRKGDICGRLNPGVDTLLTRDYGPTICNCSLGSSGSRGHPTVDSIRFAGCEDYNYCQ
ncbi:uncharacterized protein RAG0_02644 [Rhynchosporium agropyri]|uniref:Uncharacterized protein n=1 Tax=Rhynchosporium agropyri TaxID=914238 RepID=A0A1E1K2R5_9HELO|nr:uncharacterized protein RAG0_02644 [Rhynchosporium agropyri]